MAYIFSEDLQKLAMNLPIPRELSRILGNSEARKRLPEILLKGGGEITLGGVTYVLERLKGASASEKPFSEKPLPQVPNRL